MNNQLTTQPKFSVVIQTDTYKNLINNTLGDPERAKRFVANISSAVAQNPALQECDTKSVICGGLIGEALGLSCSPALAQFHLVPYKNNKTGIKEAQFQIGWHGVYQLAIRSGQYSNIIVLPIKEGELVKFNPLKEEIELNIIEDDMARDLTKTIGYYASFTLLNGFKKAMYWSKDKMLQHANRFSKAFDLEIYKKIEAGQIEEKDMWKYSSPWYTQTDDMGCKTLLKQILGKYGVLSTELQEAIVKDQAVIKDDIVEYVDNDNENVVEIEEEEENKQKDVKLKKVKLNEIE